MLGYSILMIVMGLLFLILGIMICKGNTKLIHDYHQMKIREEDKPAYGKDFSRGIFIIALSVFISGVIALFGYSATIVTAALIVLFAGLIIGLVIIARVQKKYNNGIF
jgi:preprotein translocase subunit SecG